MVKKNWIAGAINPKKAGQLRKDLNVPAGENIPAARLNRAAARNDVVGRRARLAKTLGKFGKG